MADFTPLTNLRGPAARIVEVTAVDVPPTGEAYVEMTGPDQGRRFEFGLRQGLPGVNAIENDEAVATYVGSDGSETAAAVAARAALVARETPNYANDATAANLRALIAKLDRGVADPTLLWITDSLGNEASEPPRLVANYLAQKYPAVTVRIAYWDEVGEAGYSAPLTVQTGTGSRVLTVWVASKAGSRPEYVLGSRYQAAVAALTPDAVIIMHGHNTGGPPTGPGEALQRNVFLQLTETVTATHPLAGLVLIAENPSLMAGRETWQAHKAQIIEQIAGIRGYGFLDAERAFWEYGNWQADLMADATHPNAAGSALIASLVNAALETARGVSATRLETALVTRSAKNFVTNGDFSAWASTNPDNWTLTNATFAKDTTDYETGSQAARVTATTTAGAAFAQQALSAAQVRELRGELVTIAARVRQPAANTGLAAVALVDSTAAQVRTDTDPSFRDGYGWIFGTFRVATTATALYVRLFARISGAAEVSFSVDRVYVVKGVLPLAGS